MARTSENTPTVVDGPVRLDVKHPHPDTVDRAERRRYEQVRLRAALEVYRRSTDRADARELLLMLGLAVPGKAKAGPGEPTGRED